MRNPIYAVCLLMIVIVGMMMTSCVFTPSDPITEWFTVVCIADIDGDNVQPLFNMGSYTDWRVTGDGGYVVVRDESGQLVSYCVETGETNQYSVALAEFEFWPMYDDIIIYGSDGATWDVYSLNILSGDLVQLTNVQIEDYAHAQLSLSYEVILYSNQTDSLFTLHQLNWNTLTCDTLFSNTYAHYLYPALSPDGMAVHYFHDAETDSLNGYCRAEITSSSTVFHPFDMFINLAFKQKVGTEEKFLVMGNSVIQLRADLQARSINSYLGTQLYNNASSIIYHNGTHIFEWEPLSSDDPTMLIPGRDPYVGVSEELFVFVREIKNGVD